MTPPPLQPSLSYRQLQLYDLEYYYAVPWYRCHDS